MKWISNTPIFHRLLLASLVVAIIPGIIISILSNTYIQSLNIRSQAVQSSTDAVKVATTQLANLQHLHADLIALQAETVVTTSILGDKDSSMNTLGQTLNNEITTLQTNFDQTLTAYQQSYQISTSANTASIRSLLSGNNTLHTLATDQQQTLDRVVKQEWHTYIQAQSKELQALKANKPATQLQQLLVAADAAYQPLERDWSHIVDLTERIGDLVAEVETAQTSPIIAATMLAIISILAVVIAIGSIVNFTIVRPLRQLVALTKGISQGDRHVRAATAGHDEISIVAKSMNTMLDNIVQLIQVTQDQRDTLQARIENLANEVSGIGKGNLRVQATMTGDTLGILSESFNYMVKELSSLVLRVQTAAREVEASATTVFNGLTHLVATSDNQLRQISNAVVAVEQMVAFSRQVAERTRMLEQVAREVQSIAQEGRQAVQRAVGGMSRIHENIQATANTVQTLDEHSRAISDISEIIASIATQTNNLAQDAEFQAALAQENGKGFGAVAADIQRLAERAKAETGSITTIVRSLQEEISAVATAMRDTERESTRGVKLTQEAGNSLEAIFAAIEYQAGEIGQIDQMSREQLQSFDAILQAMQRISLSTYEMNESIRTASEQMQYLLWLIDQLRASVKAFRLPQRRDYSLPPIPPAR